MCRLLSPISSTTANAVRKIFRLKGTRLPSRLSTPNEKAKDEEARRLEKAEEMKKLAQDAKVKAQAERHAKLLAEREAQKTA